MAAACARISAVKLELEEMSVSRSSSSSSSSSSDGLSAKRKLRTHFSIREDNFHREEDLVRYPISIINSANTDLYVLIKQGN